MNLPKIVFNTWPGAFFNPGGGEVQLLNSKKYLEKIGFQIDLYDQWNPQRTGDILHQFSIGTGSEHVIKEYKALNKKIVLSTIMWTIPPKDHWMHGHIKNILNQSDILLTNSEAESSRLSNFYDIPLDKFHKTRNSVSEEFLTTGNEQLFRERYNIDDEFIISVANIDRRKNTKLLIQACRNLKKKLILIGHIRDHQYFNEILQEHNECFSYLGPIEDKNILKSALTACSLFALPSICETPGIAALEAASQGAKIVITNEGPTSEYMGIDNATYVNPFELESITNGIEDELSKVRTQKLRLRVISHYTWDKTAEDIKAAYLTITQ